MFNAGISNAYDAIDWLQQHEAYTKWSYEDKLAYANNYLRWLRTQQLSQNRTAYPYGGWQGLAYGNGGYDTTTGYAQALLNNGMPILEGLQTQTLRQ